jgi:hypothetical protein
LSKTRLSNSFFERDRFISSFSRQHRRLAVRPFVSSIEINVASEIMGTVYEYVYEYDVPVTTRNQRSTIVTEVYNQHPSTRQTIYNNTTSSRTNAADPLSNMQHDRIWQKLYDPLDSDKASHDAEVQVGGTIRAERVSNRLRLFVS